MPTTAANIELNFTGPSVNSDIRRYLGSLAGKNADRFCAPSLEAIARTAWTSPMVVKERLRFFESEGLFLPVVKEINGESVYGWVVPRKKKGKHKPQTAAAGLNGNDGAFLRSCGILTED